MENGFSRNFKTSNYTKRATEQTDTDRVWWCLHISCVTRSLLPHWLGLTQQLPEYRQQYCRPTVDDGVCCHGRNPYWVSATTPLGANDSVVTVHACRAHSVSRCSRGDTGGNDGFTAWQTRIRSLDRRLRLLAVLWRYSGQIALMIVHGQHGWNILWQEKKNFSLAKKWSG